MADKGKTQVEYFGVFRYADETPAELLSRALAGWSRRNPGIDPTHVFVHSADEAPAKVADRFTLTIAPKTIHSGSLGVGLMGTVAEARERLKAAPAEPEPADVPQDRPQAAPGGPQGDGATQWPPVFAEPPRPAPEGGQLSLFG